MYKTNINGWNQWRTTYPYQTMYKTTVDGRDRWRNPCQMMHKLLMDEANKEQPIPDCVQKKLLMDDRDEIIHTRWCAKQLLMDEINEEQPIPYGAQNNGWWIREMKESTQDYVWNNCWRIRPMKYCPYKIMCYSTVDGWDRWGNETIPDDVRNNCWWMRPMKDYPYQMICKTTVGGRNRWSNPCQMMHRDRELLTDEANEEDGSFRCFSLRSSVVDLLLSYFCYPSLFLSKNNNIRMRWGNRCWICSALSCS